jgi:23S rRNA (uracil1939-C5)-methyltransferase
VGHCGGCSQQDLAYLEQLTLKQQVLRTVADAIGRTASIELHPAPEPWRYRNKLELTFGQERDSNVVLLGLHAVRSFWRIIDLQECWLVPEALVPVIDTMRRWVQAQDLPPYNPRQHTGVFRHLLLRHSRATQQIMVCLITAATEQERIRPLVTAVVRAHPEVSSVYWGMNTKPSDVSTPDVLHHMHGQTHLLEQIGAFDIAVYPFTFLQPNVAQAAQIYTMLTDWVRARAVRTAWDIYAGSGSIALHLRDVVETVWCLDSVPENIAALQENAARNGVGGITCAVDTAERFLRGPTVPLPDCIVVDPPRAGLHIRVIEAIARIKPRVLIYMSCNPTTLVQNLQALHVLAPEYQIDHMEAFDMFPQTAHLELLTCLDRRVNHS